jgi:hypothetical protein
VITPEDVAYACLAAGRSEEFVPVPDTPTARALAAELMALPIPEFLERLREIHDRYAAEDT